MIRFYFIMLFYVSQLSSASGQNLLNGLAAHWSFDHDSAGIVIDESENAIIGNSTGIVYSTGIKGKAAVFELSEDAIIFDGNDKKVAEKIALLKTGSVSVWFNFQNNGGYILPILYFGESSENAPHNSLILEIGHGPNYGDPSNRNLYFTIVNQSFCFDTRQNLVPGKWYHFVAVVSANGNTGYLNGSELINRRYNLGSDRTYHNFFADVPIQELLSIGYGRFGQNNRFFHFNGMIDEMRIYNRTLSSDEVQLLYNESEITGNKKSNDFQHFTIFPNPALQSIAIIKSIGIKRIEIFSIDGKKVFTADNENHSFAIDTGNWRKGFYIAKADNGSTVKLVIM